MIGAHQSNPLDWNPHKPLGNLVRPCKTETGEKALRTVYLYRERTAPNRCYVGQTYNENNRRGEHNKARGKNSDFHSRIKELRKDAGKKIPVHELFDYSMLFQNKVTQSEVDFYERALIFHFNAYPGGYSKCWNGGKSEKARANMRKPKSEQARANMRKPKSEQARANIKLAQNRPEVRANKSKALLGKPKSEQARANIKLAQNRPEVRANKSKALLGKPKHRKRFKSAVKNTPTFL